MKPIFRVILLFGMLVPMAVTPSGEYIQWYVFDVHGTLETSSGSPENYAVVMVGWKSWDDGGWEILRRCNERGGEYGPFVSTSLTSKTGKFGLRVSDCASGYPDHDSLAVAVVFPDTIVVGPSFAYDIVKPTVIEATFKKEEDWSCDGEYTFPDTYIYEYPAVTFPISNER